MFILTDTCFWTHVRDLHDSDLLDLRPVLSMSRWGCTAAVVDELDYFHMLDFVPTEKAFIVPVTGTELDAANARFHELQEFDLADQTIIVASLREKALVLTDDGDLILECQALGIDALELPYYCLNRVKVGMLEKRDMYRFLRHWKATCRYPRREIDRLKKALAELVGPR